MKQCPYCAEEIQDAAIICRYCGREIEPEIVARIAGGPNSEPAVRPIRSDAGVEKRKSIWPYAVGGGLILAVLSAIPRLLNLSEISEAINQGQLSALAFRAGLNDLAFGFAVNWIIWSLVIAGSIALWRWNRWAVIVPLLLLVGFLLAGSGLSGWSDILGISDLQLFQPPSFSGSTSAPVVAATNTICGLSCAFEIGATARVATLDAQSGFSGVVLTQGAIRAVALESCRADPMCQLPAPNAAATLEAASTLINPVGTAATWVAGTRAACEASPTCQTNPDPTVAAAITALSER